MNSLFDIDTDSDSNESDDQLNKGGNSSDEEMEKEFNAFFKAKSNFKPKPEKKDLADDFENEMNQEILNVIKTNQEKCKIVLKNENKNASVEMIEEKHISKKNEKIEEEEEEEDTDSEAELETGVRTTKKRQKFTNDELFYDPEMDEEDENWVNKQRKTCKKIVTPIKETNLKSILKSSSAQGDVKETKNLNSNESKITYVNAHTDAILNCPCCMTTLCMDCQRHENYRTQYRAMFVSNCKINEEEQLKYPKEEFDSMALNSKKLKKNKLKIMKEESNEISKDYDIFKPVMCSICSAEVGVFEEKEEIYHFFNVITSHS